MPLRKRRSYPKWIFSAICDLNPREVLLPDDIVNIHIWVTRVEKRQDEAKCSPFMPHTGVDTWALICTCILIAAPVYPAFFTGDLYFST
jgi:hypothetical protein